MQKIIQPNPNYAVSHSLLNKNERSSYTRRDFPKASWNNFAPCPIQQKLESIIKKKNTLYNKIFFNTCGQTTKREVERQGAVKVDSEGSTSQPPTQNKEKL